MATAQEQWLEGPSTLPGQRRIPWGALSNKNGWVNFAAMFHGAIPGPRLQFNYLSET